MFSLSSRLAAFCLALVLAALLWVPRAHAGAYEAELPANLATTPDMCALLPCTEVFPGATHFRRARASRPMSRRMTTTRPAKKLLGYVVLSTDITDTPAYSGKPVVTLIGMDTQGRFVGMKVLKLRAHPAAGHPRKSALINFNNQYIGKSVTDTIEVGPSAPTRTSSASTPSPAPPSPSSLRTRWSWPGSAVARQTGIIAPTVREQPRFVTTGQTYDWAQLVKMGACAAIAGQARTGGPAARPRSPSSKCGSAT